MAQQDVVIVTGSSGFIGSALIERLAGRYALVGFDRVAKQTPPPAAECVCIDLTSDEAVGKAFERVRIAYGARIASVIHLAAYFDLSGEESPLYEKITVRGTERLLDALQGFEVEQFVFASTMLVHAPAEPDRRINEDSERTAAGWKIFDVRISGVSLALSYRGTFAEEIRNYGIEGLIKQLEAKNRESGFAPASVRM